MNNNIRIFITRNFRFEAAHRLHNYDGPCNNLHGHSYSLYVTISGFTNDNGVVLDFKELKTIVTEEIINKIDHTYLNDVLKINNTTAENISMWIWDELQLKLKKIKTGNKLRLEKIRLFETESCYVEIRRESQYENC